MARRNMRWWQSPAQKFRTTLNRITRDMQLTGHVQRRHSLPSYDLNQARKTKRRRRKK